MSPHRARKWSVRAAALLAIATATAGCATPVAGPAAPLKPSPAATSTAEEDSDDLALQERMDDFIDSFLEGREEVDVPGLAGLRVDEGSGLVELYWVGDPPASVRQRLDAPPVGVSVVVHPARFDTASMVKALEDVDDKYGDYMHGGSPTDDGSGIEIEQTAEAARKGPSPQDWDKAAGMPVKTSITEPAEPA